MFSPADDYLFISFINVHGVWPSSEDIVIPESPVATLLPPLGSVVLGIYGLFALSVHPTVIYIYLHLMAIHCLFCLHLMMIRCLFCS